eukprot:scaffold1034_cov127-Cylindrotheca_fusiformis.AAC.28
MSSRGAIHFVYTGETSCKVPDGVTHIKVEGHISEIPESAFSNLRKLTTADLRSSHDQSLEGIGDEAFWDDKILRTAILPCTLKTIGKWAFGNCSKLRPPTLPDKLEWIGDGAFCGCNFRNFRIPPSIIEISNGTFEFCCKLLSLELPEAVVHIHSDSLNGCERLRNLVLPSPLMGSEKMFRGCHDLNQIFPDTEDLVHALKNRFEGLPLHSMCYYQSYTGSATTSESIRQASLKSLGTMSNGSQDCLGMTPLHILALSAKPDIDIIRALLLQGWSDKLMTKDKWGYLPLYYACECDASIDIIQLFVEGHETLFPNEALDWTKMVKTSRLDLAQVLLASKLVFSNLPSRIKRRDM